MLLDSRRELNEDDIDIINYLEEKEVPYKLVFTKVDKINQSEKHHLLVELKKHNISESEIIFTSTLKLRTFEALRNVLQK